MKTFHEKMVENIYSILPNKGFSKIRADIEGYPKIDLEFWFESKPENKKKPDLLAEKDGFIYIIECKSTHEAFDFDEVKEQLIVFNAYAASPNLHQMYRFWLVVPIEIKAKAEKIKKDWNLSHCEILRGA